MERIMERYRLAVGEHGNEQGHIVATHAKSMTGARIALGMVVAKYQGDGWGHIEYRHDNGEWERL